MIYLAQSLSSNSSLSNLLRREHRVFYNDSLPVITIKLLNRTVMTRMWMYLVHENPEG